MNPIPHPLKVWPYAARGLLHTLAHTLTAITTKPHN